MADPLYLSLWFPSFQEAEMLPRALLVMKQFPFTVLHPGITYMAVHPVSWSEPTILERRFTTAAPPEEAIEIAGDLLHDDYAYVFEAAWDLWAPDERGEWALQPRHVKFILHGIGFEDGIYEQEGHIEIDLGLDTAFLYEDMNLDETAEKRVRANVHKLITFSAAVEENCGVTARVLWSESEENLAQKLIARLQKVN